MMTASGRKKRLFMLAGLLLLLVAGLLWHAGTLLQSSRKEVRKSIPQAAAPAAVVTKKLAAPVSAEAVPAGGDALVVRNKLPPHPPVAAAALAPAPAATGSAPPGTPESSAAAAAETAPAAAVLVTAAGPALPAAEPPAPVPAPAAAPPAPSPPLKVAKAKTERGSFPFSILLSSCREKENALAALTSFQRTGAPLYIVPSAVKGKGGWWRVLTGLYRSADEAGQARKALGIPGAVVVRTPYANHLGAFPSEAAAADAAARVKALGYFPYMLQGAEGSVELVVGAFLAEIEAENLQRELKAQGIPSEVIRR
jgi:hypothetical protein